MNKQQIQDSLEVLALYTDLNLGSAILLVIGEAAKVLHGGTTDFDCVDLMVTDGDFDDIVSRLDGAADHVTGGNRLGTVIEVNGVAYKYRLFAYGSEVITSFYNAHHRAEGWGNVHYSLELEFVEQKAGVRVVDQQFTADALAQKHAGDSDGKVHGSNLEPGIMSEHFRTKSEDEGH